MYNCDLVIQYLLNNVLQIVEFTRQYIFNQNKRQQLGGMIGLFTVHVFWICFRLWKTRNDQNLRLSLDSWVGHACNVNKHQHWLMAIIKIDWWQISMGSRIAIKCIWSFIQPCGVGWNFDNKQLELKLQLCYLLWVHFLFRVQQSWFFFKSYVIFCVLV